MRLRLSRRQAVLAAAVLVATLVAAVLAAAVGTRAALVLVVLVQGAVLLGLVVVRAEVAAVRRQVRSDLPAQVRDLRSAVAEARSGALFRSVLDSVAQDRLDTVQRYRTVESSLARLDGELDRTRHDVAELRRLSVQHAAQSTTDTWSLLNLGRLVEVDDELPSPGGWAVTPQTLLALLTEIRDRAVAPIVVECGSGTSTVWLAAALRRRGAGRVVALEHEPHYAEQTRWHLHRLGLDPWAEVRDAPLTDVRVGGEEQPWYDPAAVDDLHGVDVLLVDGPPGATGPSARYPAFPLLADRLAPGATVVLDDVDRDDEQVIAQRWTTDGAHGLRLREARRLDRAQFFTVTDEPPAGAEDAPTGAARMAAGPV